MKIKKIIALVFFAFLSAANVFAGPEDWDGGFVIQNSKGDQAEVYHAPTKIKFMFIQAKSFSFSRGLNFNGFVSSAAGVLAADADVPTFVRELSKWGQIVDREINLGPTYPKH